MNIEKYFEEKKGITVDAARNGRARYTAIDICLFAKKYHESEVDELKKADVIKQTELLTSFLLSRWAAHSVNQELEDDYCIEMFLNDFNNR